MPTSFNAERCTQHRLDTHERPKHTYEYYVTGSGEFPWDMLRYDACWPTDSIEAFKMGIGFWGHDDEYKKLRSIKMRSYREPTIGRWSSFTWSVGLHNLETRRLTTG